MGGVFEQEAARTTGIVILHNMDQYNTTRTSTVQIGWSCTN